MIAQVERLAAAEALPAKQVAVPGVLVDCVVVAAPEHHPQTYATSFSAAFSGQLRVPLDRIPPLPLDERKIIARRCACEPPMGGVVNLGIGMPEAVAAVAMEENLLEQVTLTAEPDRRLAAGRARLRGGGGTRAPSSRRTSSSTSTTAAGSTSLASAWRRSMPWAM